MTRFHHQRQRYATNCGPTCVAILIGVSQDAASRAMFGQTRCADLWSYYAEVGAALQLFGFAVATRARRVTAWDRIPSLSIVACSAHADGGCHFVVCAPDEGLIYDPARTAPIAITECRRRPFSYLAVTDARTIVGRIKRR